MHTKYLLLIISVYIHLIVALEESDNESIVKNNCIDFPSCYLISSRMFVNYCGKSTLKSMCPTFCLPECNLTTIQQLSTTTTTLLNFDTTTSVDKVRTFKFNFAERLIDTEQAIKSTTMKMKASLNKYSLFIPKNETKEPELEEITTTNPSIIYVPLFQAGFISRIIVTSSKNECNFTQAIICKRESCANEHAWCPESNNVPKEQIEFHFNYTNDIYMLETQGSMLTNETVNQFLLQYQNESGGLVSKIFKTYSNSSTKINKFLFEHPLRTNYIRITPIEFTIAIVMRFEFYSKGILYTQN